MPHQNSNWTGRTPRRLTDAFGPHTDNVLHPMPTKQSSVDLWVSAACIVILLVALGAVYFGSR